MQYKTIRKWKKAIEQLAARDTYVRLLNEAKGAPAKGEGVRSSYEGAGANPYTEYDKPITRADVEKLWSILDKVPSLNGIRRFSVNQFSHEDLVRAQKWAYYMFYGDDETPGLGVKSPFFRASFGEWRVHQSEKTGIAYSSSSQYPSGNTLNKDTKRKLS